MMNFENMGELVNAWRKINKMTQGQLAKKLGYNTPQFISNVERGVCSFPPDKFNRLCRILNLNMDLLKEAYMCDVKENLNREVSRAKK
jgi:transcriptional regulator with XRE-family HTH domain